MVTVTWTPFFFFFQIHASQVSCLHCLTEWSSFDCHIRELRKWYYKSNGPDFKCGARNYREQGHIGISIVVNHSLSNVIANANTWRWQVRMWYQMLHHKAKLFTILTKKAYLTWNTLSILICSNMGFSVVAYYIQWVKVSLLARGGGD